MQGQHRSQADYGLKPYEKDKVILLQRLWRVRKFFKETRFDDTAYLEGIEQELKKTDIPLSANPPVAKAVHLHFHNAKQYLECFKDLPIRETARKILFDGYITHVSFSDFKEYLKSLMLRLNHFLLAKKLISSDITFLTEPRHSTAWVSGLALRYLPFIPTQVEKYDGELAPKWVAGLIQKKKRNFLLFDDWSLSGNQLEKILTNIILGKRLAELHYCDNADLRLNIILIIPLITKRAYKRLKSCFKISDKEVALTLFTAKCIPTIEELEKDLSPTDKENLSKILDSDFPPDSQVLAFSDWKVPDATSMPAAITDGRVPWALTSYHDKDWDSIPDGVNNNPFIPRIIPPYR